MVIVELIGSISLAIALVSAVALTIVHIKHKTYTHDHHLNNIEITNYLQEDINQLSAVLPFERFNMKNELPVLNVINTDEISSATIKYGIQWTSLSNAEAQPTRINSLSDTMLKTSEFEQGDSLSWSDQTTSVRNLIEKFENNLIEKSHRKEKNNQTDSDLTSIDTNFDNQTIKTNVNQNEQQFSHHSSLSNFDVTIPSNLSSSIDLEQFECLSTSSDFSEFLKNNF